ADPVVDTDPEVLYVSSKKNIVLFGDTIHIQCIFAGRPTPDITWRRVNSTMPPTAIFLNDNYELVIPNATFRHSGKYECIATNSVGTKSYRTRIVVQSKPYFIEPWVPFIEGLKFGTYQLECPVAGVPPVSILWYRNGVPFYPKPDSDPFHLIRGKFGDRLVFEKAVPEMTGVYQCNASNIHGNIFANAFVNIADCPICPQRPFPICGSDGNTYKNSCFMRMKNCIEDTDIQPVLCGPCINTTSGDAEGPPSAPSDTHLQSCSYGKRGKEELSDSIAEVMWQQSNGYCVPILNYIVEVKNTTSNASAAWEILYDNIPGDILRVTAKLPPVGNYRLRVRAITEIGVSKPSRETSECPGRGGGQSIDISDANRNTDDSAPGSGVSRTMTCGAIAWPLLFAILRHFW
ncbi:PREDICTED: neuroglian-like, partial [Priapulus caudatus]|uniref:Neuroglian-like n=1 Tax=Priapulus caudatus TaxID=37621 RepID=A0ABM1F0P7_PRICU